MNKPAISLREKALEQAREKLASYRESAEEARKEGDKFFADLYDKAAEEALKDLAEIQGTREWDLQ